MQPASPSPLYASPLSSVGYSTELPAGYTVHSVRGGFEVISDEFGLIDGPCGSVFDSYAGACYAAQDFAEKADESDRRAAAEMLAEAATETEAAYRDELNKLYALVNAQGGYVEPEDKAGQARVRAINDVLAFIEKVAA